MQECSGDVCVTTSNSGRDFTWAFQLDEFATWLGAHAPSPCFIYQYPITGEDILLPGIKYWMLSKMFAVLIFLLWVSAAISITHIPIFHREFSLCLNAWFVSARERVCVDPVHLCKLCMYMISVSELHQGCVLWGKPVNRG